VRDDTQNPQINLAKIPVDGNVAGAIFVVGTVAICLTGIPGLGYPALAAVILGGGVALALRWLRH
jgi:hypothetical protein